MRTARATQKQANMALEIGKAVLFGLVISFILVVLYAVALKEEMLPAPTMTVFTTAIKVICAAAAGIIAVQKCRHMLWMYGALSGAVYTLLAFGVFSLVAGTLHVSAALISDVGMGALSGLLSVMIMQILK